MKNFVLVILLGVLLCVLGCKKGSAPGPSSNAGQNIVSAKEIIAPNVAGQFYPLAPDSLKAMIENFFSQTPEIKFPDNMLGFMSPHAGYEYSGPVAAYIFKNLPLGRFKRVVILFPSHWQSFRGILALDQDAYRTPLGDVPIDRESVKKLILADPAIFWKPDLYMKEHAGEVMLPFLQERLGDTFKIIPLMMGDQSPGMARNLAEVLNQVFGADRDVLYIASSDMSHYHDYGTANALDAVALNQIMHLDPDALVGDMGSHRAELCGYGPVLTLMQLSRMRGAESAKILKHLNSGDTAGDKSRVVGYGAVEFFSK